MENSHPLMKQPLVILAPGPCFGTAVSAMLAQHPRLFGLMETQLFTRDTLSGWWEDFGVNLHSHGLLRSIAAMVFGDQSAKSVDRAKRWLWKRVDSSTASVFAELAGLVYPLIPIDSTPMLTYRIEHMQRVFKHHPAATFLHLTRHPVTYGNSLLKLFRRRAPLRHSNQSAALLRNPESIFYGMIEEDSESSILDPQRAWYLRHSAVASFTAELPDSQHLRIRSEDLLNQPSTTLGGIAAWIGLDADLASIGKMLHPERWPFACIGPWNARFGGDTEFLHAPMFPSAAGAESGIDEPVPWLEDGSDFKDEIRRLAREFGYS